MDEHIDEEEFAFVMRQQKIRERSSDYPYPITPYKLAQWFGGAKGVVSAIKRRIEYEKVKLDLCLKREREIRDAFYDEDTEAKLFYQQVHVYRIEARNNIKFFEQTLSLMRPPKKKKGWIERSDVEKALQYPITNLIPFPKGKDVCCIFHQERTPSLHLYKRQNKVHCFGGCGSFDVINVYQRLHNCDFITAVRSLKDNV